MQIDRAFTFTYFTLRFLSSEVEICALSISIRQAGLGGLERFVAAFEGLVKSEEREIRNAVNSAIGVFICFEQVSMCEDDKN